MHITEAILRDLRHETLVLALLEVTSVVIGTISVHFVPKVNEMLSKVKAKFSHIST